MDRRDVLKLGAVATVSGAGCATLIENPSAVGDNELMRFLADLDLAMAKVGGTDFVGKVMNRDANPVVQERSKAAEALAKKTMRSMMLVGTLAELPPDQLAHPAVQQRLQGSMGEFDEAMFGMAATLENLSPSERSGISKALAADPQLGMRIMGAVDQEAADFGISMKQRVKLRAVSTEVNTRLKLSTDLAATEYVGKMRKIAVRHGALAEAERQAAAQMTMQLLWQRAAEGGSRTSPPPPPPPSSDPTPPPPPPPVDTLPPRDGEAPVEPPPPVEERKAFRTPHALITAGGAALGLAALSLGIGYASGNSGGILVGITFGAILGISGLVVLLIGLIMLAAGR